MPSKHLQLIVTCFCKRKKLEKFPAALLFCRDSSLMVVVEGQAHCFNQATICWDLKTFLTQSDFLHLVLCQYRTANMCILQLHVLHAYYLLHQGTRPNGDGGSDLQLNTEVGMVLFVQWCHIGILFQLLVQVRDATYLMDQSGKGHLSSSM